MVRVSKGNETERTISRRKSAGRVKENWVRTRNYCTSNMGEIYDVWGESSEGAPLRAVVIRPFTARVAIWQQRNL
jgi:hypothetical protein